MQNALQGADPCASGAPLEACSACSTVTEIEWNQLRTVFQERSAKRASKNQPDSERKPEASKIDDSILDLNTDDQPVGSTRYTSPTRKAVPTNLSPLLASSSGGVKFLEPTIPPPRSAAFQTVLVSSSTVFFKTPAPVQSTSNQDPVFTSDPQRLVPPPTLCTQMLKAHFEQQNMQMMENLSQQNQKQIQDLSLQLQSGFQ